MTFFFVRISLSRASSSSSVATLPFFGGLGRSSSPRPVPFPSPPFDDGVAMAGSVEVVLPFFDLPSESAAMVLFFGVSMILLWTIYLWFSGIITT
jgi:hypothetical protein